MGTREAINILMVDDQPSKLLTYEAMLGELGENLLKAGSGREALEILLKTDVAVVLMDVSMPEIDGFELAGLICQHPRCQRTAIIFVSAVHLTDLDRLKGYQRGAVDYVSVPIIPELLRAKVTVFSELYRKNVQLERLNLELRRLSSRLLSAQDEERRRFARDLHDGIGQDLAAAKMMLDGTIFRPTTNVNGGPIHEASDILDRAIQQIRTMSHLLHPPLLDEGGLLSALRWFLDGMTARSGIRTSLDLQPRDFPRLQPEMERNVFRIVQEALTNVFRHSEAMAAYVKIIRNDNSLLLMIGDDGKGLGEQTIKLQPTSIGVGIGSMRERARELGGELKMRNGNPGTIVEVLVPNIVLANSYAGAGAN
ncbi:MAG TPA: response regulator [Terriglobales bacterium]|nr:response regulator [Terriglobales bacterium]